MQNHRAAEKVLGKEMVTKLIEHMKEITKKK